MTLRRIGLALLAAVVLALGALAWRLDRGPIAVPFVAGWIETALAERGLEDAEVAAARLAWEGWEEGGLAPVEIRLSGVRAALPSGGAAVELPEVAVAIPVGALLRGAVAPSRVTLRDPLLRLRRAEDGSLDLGPLGGGQGTAGDTAASPLDALRRVEVTGGRVVVEDRQLGTEWSLRDLTLALRRDDGGLPTGQAAAELRIGGETVPLRLAATRAEEGEGRLHLALSVPRLVPAALARAVPSLAPLGILDAPASLSAEARLDQDGRPLALAADLEAGPGALDPPVAGRVPFTALRVAAAADPKAVRVERLVLQLAPAPEGRETGPTLTATGRATLDGGRWQAEAELALDRASLAALETWWPRGLAPAARGWVAENLVAGTLRDGRWRVVATAPRDLDRIALASLDGTARLEGVAVRWHPALPPIEGLTGTAAFDEGGITLHAEEARQSGTALRLPEGRLRLTGLGAGPARAELRGRVTGPVSDLWTILRTPGLGLLAGRELPVRDPTGTVEAEVDAAIPLAGSSAATDPAYSVTGRLTELRLPDLVLGQTLSDGAFDVTLAEGRLRAEGTGRLGGIPLRGGLALDFGAARPDGVAVEVTASASVQAARLAEFGFDPGEALQGPLALELRYDAAGDEPARLTVQAGLEAARIAIAPLGYHKPRGVPARAEAALRIADGALRSIERLEVEAPDLALRASATEGGRVLEIAEGQVGETRFAGTLRLPEGEGGPWRIALRGPVLDLRPILENAGGDGGASAPGGGIPPLALEARFDRALTPAPAGPLQDLALRATVGAGGEVREAAAEAGGPGGFAATLSARPEGGRALRLEAADAGALLAAFSIAAPLEGGRLDIAATQPSASPDAPVAGTAEITGFTLHEVPAAAKLLQAVTGYGLPEALSGPGLGVSRLTAPFRYEDGVLTLGEARAFSASLGVTATGRVDLRRGTLDLEGTLVPAYVFNSLLGNLPIVGRLFSPERGGGLFSASFEVEGPWRDPQVSVNPLTALTPGFLRGLFDLGDDAPAAEPARPAP